MKSAVAAETVWCNLTSLTLRISTRGVHWCLPHQSPANIQNSQKLEDVNTTLTIRKILHHIFEETNIFQLYVLKIINYHDQFYNEHVSNVWKLKKREKEFFFLNPTTYLSFSSTDKLQILFPCKDNFPFCYNCLTNPMKS